VHEAAQPQFPSVETIPVRVQTRREYLSAIRQRTAIVPIIAFVACSVAYFFTSLVISSRAPLWMDEVMASWMSQLPWRTIWAAIAHGTISTPPTYFYLLKGVTSVFGYSHIALRMPSILSVYFIGVIAFLMMRRRFSFPVATLSMMLCFETGLFSYATQVREYSLMTLCFALAAFLWYPREGQGMATWRLVLITLLLATAIALHFYAVLLVVAFGLMELLWSFTHRRIRFGVWLAAFIAGASVFAWLPLMRQIMKYTGKYGASADYYAKPKFSHLLTTYSDLAFGVKGVTLLSFLLCVIALAFFWARYKRVSSVAPETDAPGKARVGWNTNLEIIVLCALAVPAIVYVFALLVTHTFNDRYAIAACFGFAMMLSRLISYFRFHNAISYLAVAGSILLLVGSPRRTFFDPDVYAMQSLSSTPDTAPIVVGEALAFFELQAQAKPQLLKRLVFLRIPVGVTSPDVTNEDLLQRWKEFRPDLNIQNTEGFMNTNPHFYVIHTSQSTDVITPYLTSAGKLSAVWNKTFARDPRNINDRDNRNVWLFEVKPDSGPTMSR
jgi:hypothetical protein